MLFGKGGAAGAAGATKIISTGSGPITFDSTTDNIYSGVMSGAGKLIKSNLNTLTLSGANTYSGPTIINGGVLELAATGLLGGGTYSGSIENSGELRFGNTLNQSILGVISGTGSITKNGASTLTLSGVNTYSGPTLVNTGKLVGVTGGAALNTSVLVGNGAATGVSLLVPGSDWSCASLTYTGGSAELEIDLSVWAASTVALLRVNGDLSVTGIVSLVVKNGLWPSTGSFPLVSYAGTMSGPGSINLAGLPAGVSATLVNNIVAKQIELNVTEIPVATGTISQWRRLDGGNASGDWDISDNWSSSIADGVDAVADFSTLNLAAAATVNINTPHTVGTLLFGDTSPSHNWNLTNAKLTLASSVGMPIIAVANNTAVFNAGLAGSQGFQKNGPGTLQLYGLAQNTLSGTVLVADGTLAINKGESLRNTTCSIMVNAGASLDINGQWVYTPVANTLYLNGNGVGARGALHLWENQDYAGPINLLTDSRITFQNECAITGPIIAMGGGRNLELNQPALNEPRYALTISGSLKLGTGRLTFSGDFPAGGSERGCNFLLKGANSYSGGTVLTNYAKLRIVHQEALGSGGVTLHTNSALDLNYFNTTIPWLRGTGGVINDTAGDGVTTLTVEQDEDTNFAGKISDGNWRRVALSKKGTGSLTLSNTNTYTGPTTVLGGILGVEGTLAESAVTIASGCGFGASTTGSVGQAALAGTLTFQDNSRLLVDVGRSEADTISVSGNVTVGNNVELRVNDGLLSGGRWKVIESADGTLAGDFVLVGGINTATLERSANALWLRIPLRGTVLILR